MRNALLGKALMTEAPLALAGRGTADRDIIDKNTDGDQTDERGTTIVVALLVTSDHTNGSGNLVPSHRW